MKTYSVLCRTCDGDGIIFTRGQGMTSLKEICPVCKGSKVQIIVETSPNLELSDMIRMIQ